MARKSTIRKLPPELRKEIDRLLLDDRLTHAQIVAHMQKLGAHVSESAVYRYNVSFQEVARDIRATREMANAIGRDLDSVEGMNIGRVVVESLQALVFKARMQLDPAKPVDAGLLKSLASTVRDLSTAMKASIDAEEKTFERMKKIIAAATGQLVRERGLSAKTAAEIKAQILGLSIEALRGGTPTPQQGAGT